MVGKPYTVRGKTYVPGRPARLRRDRHRLLVRLRFPWPPHRQRRDLLRQRHFRRAPDAAAPVLCAGHQSQQRPLDAGPPQRPRALRQRPRHRPQLQGRRDARPHRAGHRRGAGPVCRPGAAQRRRHPHADGEPQPGDAPRKADGPLGRHRLPDRTEATSALPTPCHTRGPIPARIRRPTRSATWSTASSVSSATPRASRSTPAWTSTPPSPPSTRWRRARRSSMAGSMRSTKTPATSASSSATFTDPAELDRVVVAFAAIARRRRGRGRAAAKAPPHG